MYHTIIIVELVRIAKQDMRGNNNTNNKRFGWPFRGATGINSHNTEQGDSLKSTSGFTSVKI